MKTKRIIITLILIIVLLSSFIVYQTFFDKNKGVNQNQLSDKQINSLIKKVSKLILVPDEKPVIATIIKAEDLMKEQNFYVGSRDGDYLIVFTEAKKALIYREKEDMLINVGPIIVDQEKVNSNKPTDDTVKKDIKSTSTEDKVE